MTLCTFGTYLSGENAKPTPHRITPAHRTFRPAHPGDPRAQTLAPPRARRIDERITRALGQLPPELLELDQNPEPQPLTPTDATLTAVNATIGGGWLALYLRC